MLFMVQPSFSEQNVVTDMPIANIGEMKRLTTNHSKVCVVCIRWGHVPNSHHTLQTTDKKKTHTNTENMEGMPANISSYPYPFEHNGNIVCYNIRILTRHSRIYNICYKCRLKRAKKLIGTTSTEHWLTFAFYGLHWSLCDMQECVLWTVCRGTQHMCHPPPTHRRHMRCVCMKYELLYT